MQGAGCQKIFVSKLLRCDIRSQINYRTDKLLQKNKKLSYELVSVDKLVSDPKNARLHDDANIAAIMGSMREFGQQKPIVVLKDFTVIAGNGTLAAAKELGWDHIAVSFTELEGDKARAYALADNRTSELASWDKGILGGQLQKLYEDGFNIADIGFDPDAFIPKFEPKIPNEDTGETKENLVLHIHCSNMSELEELFSEMNERGLKVKI